MSTTNGTDPATNTGGAPPAKPDSDVVIIGSGFAGSILASILARNGASVVVLDAGSHPRFAVGESTTRIASLRMKIIAERYGVPELKSLASFEGLHSEVSASCGIKDSFGFIYHRENGEQHAEEHLELVVSSFTNPETHLFRQDVDARLHSIAVSYGARAFSNVRVSDFEFDDQGVTISTQGGRSWRTRYVIDASGFRSPLAKKLGLREDPPSMRHHSRSMFTHMVDVGSYDDAVAPRTLGNILPWNKGTLHHMFPGGWFWVIPFNNHALARNNLTSVGVTVDPRIHPKPDCSPEEEFRYWLHRFPSIERQFSSAAAARDWVSTGRLQYTSSRTVGDRWCLTAHAAGFVDPLFSRGLTDTLDSIIALGGRLLDALRDDEFRAERFQAVEDAEKARLHNNDNLVANTFTSFQDFDLLNAWLRVWITEQFDLNLESVRAYWRLLSTGDRSGVARLEEVALRSSDAEFSPANRLYNRANEEILRVERGEQSTQAAARAITKLITEADFIPPMLKFRDMSCRSMHLITAKNLAQVLSWARKSAPPHTRDLVIEGVSAFFKMRMRPGEFNRSQELKHIIAGVPARRAWAKASR